MNLAKSRQTGILAVWEQVEKNKKYKTCVTNKKGVNIHLEPRRALKTYVLRAWVMLITYERIISDNQNTVDTLVKDSS